MSFDAHLRTIWNVLRPPAPAPPAEAFATSLVDPAVGPVRITGLLRRPAGARRLLLLLHGLGGSAESRYLRPAAALADARGWATLRLNLRGADRSGEDYYHAGLTDDVTAALADPRLAGFERLHVLGYSLGGHVALRWASRSPDPRLVSVAAVCSPLDLARGQRLIDRRHTVLYRRYLLRGLVATYRAVAARRPVAVPPAEVARARTIRRFDELVVVPRFGFADADDYYARASVGPRLGRLRVPALLVAAAGDPLVPPGAIEPWLATTPALEARFVERGGHVAFGGELDLGLRGVDAGPGLETQILGWMDVRG